MGADAYGWVEICDDEGDWLSVIYASIFMERDYRVFATLFGVRNSFGVQPIADERGIPINASQAVKADVNTFSCHSSWVTWKEIKTVRWQEPLWGGWILLFDMMASLATHYGHENVRLVAWFDQ